MIFIVASTGPAVGCSGSSGLLPTGGGPDVDASSDSASQGTTDDASGGNENDATGPSSDDASGARGDSGPLADDGASADATGVPDVSSGDAPTASCPNVAGAYSIAPLEIQGCGMTLNRQAPQCIQQGPGTCTITFLSVVTGGGKVAINGNAMVQNDGSFMGAALVEGALPRTGCAAIWDATASTLTVDCGGTGTSQSCVLGLKRTSSSCP